ncbi:MAG: hypothetical protein V3V08_07705 [Nannocystaceae bacterium]
MTHKRAIIFCFVAALGLSGYRAGVRALAVADSEQLGTQPMIQLASELKVVRRNSNAEPSPPRTDEHESANSQSGQMATAVEKLARLRAEMEREGANDVFLAILDSHRERIEEAHRRAATMALGTTSPE